jgi:hypothetical protein
MRKAELKQRVSAGLGMPKAELKQRTFDFAVRVVRLIATTVASIKAARQPRN